jgi:hypothetical protein
MAEKLLVNDFVVNFGVDAAPADEIVSTAALIAKTAVRLPSLLSFFRPAPSGPDVATVFGFGIRSDRAEAPPGHLADFMKIS